jgi:hypothetical protein
VTLVAVKWGMSMKVLAILSLAVALLSGCGGSTTAQPAPTVTVIQNVPAPIVTQAAPIVTQAAPIPPVTPSTSTIPSPAYAIRLPAGYPKLVRVSRLPDQVKYWLSLSDYKQAVQLAPGVWTPLPPGAEIQDAVNEGEFDGFCASIEAFTRKFDVPERGGTCW